MTKVMVTVILLTIMVVPLSAAAGTVQLPVTGQTSSYGTNDDGALKKGVTWPSPRFTDNINGTVTDNLTGLIWVKNANCFGVQWTAALKDIGSLANGQCGLTDGSTAGQWRLPNVRELESLVNVGQSNTAAWLNVQGFSSVQSGHYWSSITTPLRMAMRGTSTCPTATCTGAIKPSATTSGRYVQANSRNLVYGRFDADAELHSMQRRRLGPRAKRGD